MKKRKIRVIALLFVLVGVLMTLVYNINMSEVNAETNKEIVFEFQNSVEVLMLAQNKDFYSKIKKKNLPKNVEIEWYSSNEQIAPVYNNGTVAGLERGRVEIKAVIKGTNYSTSCIVEVEPQTLECYLKDSGTKINSYKCEKGESFAIRVNDIFNSVHENELIYSSSNEDVAVVDQEGNITTKNVGRTKIVTSFVGNSKRKNEIILEVTTAVKELKIYDYDYETYIGDKTQIDFEVFPSNATNKNVKFEVADKKIATVSSTGKIQGKDAGETTITITSKSNPEIQQKVKVTVEGQRDYRLVKSPEISQNEEYILKFLKKGETLRIDNNYSDNVKLSCNNEALINYELTERYINITGVERGVAILQITDNGVVDKVKILVNKYQDDETNANIIPVTKLILPTKENDLLEGMNYINETNIAVGETWEFKYYISPINASVDDLQYSISNEKDFALSTNGKVTAINPNKTTKLVVSSKSNPSVTKTITLRSTIGNVQRVEFAKKYVGENSLDINKSKSFPFNPIFYMESGMVLDPTKENLSNNETYKKLLRNVKIRTDDTDLIRIQNNSAYPIEGVSGRGRLELVYNEGKEDERRAITDFDSDGNIIETITSIKFAKSEYKISEGGDYNFNPIIVTNTKKTYNPANSEVRESQEYKNLLSKVQLEKVPASNGYVGTGNLVNIFENNAIRVVYEGKCKLKMVVVGTDISAETVLNVNFNNDIEKHINDYRYIDPNLISLVSDKNSPSTSSVVEVSRGDKVFVYEKYKDGWVRVKYQENDQLYIKASYLLVDPPQAANKNEDIEKIINDYRYIRVNGAKLSPAAGTGDPISVPKATKIYVIEKYKNGWVRVEYQGNDQLYIDANKNLSEQPPTIATEEGKKGIVVVSDKLNVRAEPTTSSKAVGSLYANSTVSILDKDGNWYMISYNGSKAFVCADYVKIYDSSSSNGTSVPESDKAIVNKILEVASKYLGVPYLWGGITPAGFDCSGFVQYVFKECGISITRTTYTQWDYDGVYVSRSELQPGDLVYFGSSSAPHHVGIYVGNGTYIHAPRTGDVIKYSSLDSRSDFAGGKRVIN